MYSILCIMIKTNIHYIKIIRTHFLKKLNRYIIHKAADSRTHTRFE